MHVYLYLILLSEYLLLSIYAYTIYIHIHIFHLLVYILQFPSYLFYLSGLNLNFPTCSGTEDMSGIRLYTTHIFWSTPSSNKFSRTVHLY